MPDIVKGDTIDHLTDEEKKAFRLSHDEDTMGFDEHKEGGAVDGD